MCPLLRHRVGAATPTSVIGTIHSATRIVNIAAMPTITSTVILAVAMPPFSSRRSALLATTLAAAIIAANTIVSIANPATVS